MWFPLVVSSILDWCVPAESTCVAPKQAEIGMLASHEAGVIDVIKDEKPIIRSLTAQTWISALELAKDA